MSIAFEKGEEIGYISEIIRSIKIRYSKILEINEEEKTITLENAMVLKFVNKSSSAWLTYRNIKTGKSVLVKDKF